MFEPMFLTAFMDLIYQKFTILDNFFQKITHNKEISVAGVMHFHNGILHWDVQFSRLDQEWGLESSTAFMDLIYSRLVKGDGLDKLCWRLAKSRGFEVCSYYHSVSLPRKISFPWKVGC